MRLTHFHFHCKVKLKPHFHQNKAKKLSLSSFGFQNTQAALARRQMFAWFTLHPGLRLSAWTTTSCEYFCEYYCEYFCGYFCEYFCECLCEYGLWTIILGEGFCNVCALINLFFSKVFLFSWLYFFSNIF